MTTIRLSSPVPDTYGGMTGVTKTLGTMPTTVVTPTLLGSSSPGSATESLTLTSGHFPTITGASPSLYNVNAWSFGQNTDSVSRTLQFSLSRNGGTAAANQVNWSVAAGSYYCLLMGHASLSPWLNSALVAGDVLDLRLWASAASVVNYEWVGWAINWPPIFPPVPFLRDVTYATSEVFPSTNFPGGASASTSTMAIYYDTYATSTSGTTTPIHVRDTLSRYIAEWTSGTTIDTNAVKGSVARPGFLVATTIRYRPVRSYE